MQILQAENVLVLQCLQNSRVFYKIFCVYLASALDYVKHALPSAMALARSWNNVICTISNQLKCRQRTLYNTRAFKNSLPKPRRKYCSCQIGKNQVELQRKQSWH